MRLKDCACAVLAAAASSMASVARLKGRSDIEITPLKITVANKLE
jgi:hypothetical protein